MKIKADGWTERAIAAQRLAPPFSVAVIMSVYSKDCPQKFRRALSSIFDQEIIENITVNIYVALDGPVDPEIEKTLYEFEDAIFRVLKFNKNRGLVFVLNDIISILEDEKLVFRMDADDYSHPTRFRKQIAEFLQSPDIDILGTAIWEVNSANNRRLVNFASSHENAISNIHWRVPVAHPTVCVKRDVLVALGGYPAVSMNEDVALWFQCVAHGFKFANLKEPLLDFTVTDEFFNRRGSNKAVGEFLVYSKGIWQLYGVTWKYIVPVIRLIFRFMPTSIQKLGYQSKFR